MTDSVSIVFFDNESFLHNLYIGYGISSLKKIFKDIKAIYVNEKNYQSISKQIDSKYVLVYLSENKYSLFKKFIECISDDIVLVACHYVPTMFGKEIMESNKRINYVLFGEIDQTLEEFFNCLINKESLSKCKGVFSRDGNKILFSGKRELISNLDDVNFPDRDLIDKNRGVFHVIASRGCDGTCTFCDRNYIYKLVCQKQRFRSIDNVISEVDYLVDNYNCKFINFADSTFCNNSNLEERLLELYEKLLCKPYWVQFFVNLRIEHISDKTLDILNKLKTVGLGRVFIGIESFSDKDLHLYNKQTSSKIILNSLNKINSFSTVMDDFQLDFEYGFIMFNPYTTISDLKMNLKVLEENNIFINPNSISSRLVCSSFTPITKKIDSDNLLNDSYNHMNLLEKTSSDIKYKFKYKETANIFNAFLMCKNQLSIVVPSNIVYIRNRYYKYFGRDIYLNKLDVAYLEWKEKVSKFCYDICNKIIEMESVGISSIQVVNDECATFKGVLNRLNEKLNAIKNRVMIQLQKINQIIYDK